MAAVKTTLKFELCTGSIDRHIQDIHNKSDAIVAVMEAKLLNVFQLPHAMRIKFAHFLQRKRQAETKKKKC